MREARRGRLVVVDSDGATIQHARLLLPPEALGWPTTLSLDALVEVASSNERGEIVLWSSLAPHALAMVVREGFAPSFVATPEAGASEPSRVVLRESATIAGRVLGASASSGRLAVVGESQEHEVPSARHLPIAHVDADGAFWMEGLIAGIGWTLVPCVRLGDEWRAAGEPMTADAPATGVTLLLIEAYGPVTGVEVVLRQRSFQQGIRVPAMVGETASGAQRSETGPAREAVARTAEDGIAHFERVPTGGLFEASFRDAERFPLLAPIALEANDREAVLQDGSGAALRLRLVWSDGRPGAGIAFVVRSPELRFRHLGTTGEDGALVVGGLASGAYLVGLEIGRQLELRLEAGEEHEETVVLGQ